MIEQEEIRRHIISNNKKQVVFEIAALLPFGTMIAGNSAGLLFEGKLSSTYLIHCLCKKEAIESLIDDNTPRDGRGRIILKINGFVFFINTYEEETITNLTRQYKCVYDISSDILYMTKGCEDSIFPVKYNAYSFITKLIALVLMLMLYVLIVTSSAFLFNGIVTFCVGFIATICSVTSCYYIKLLVLKYTNRLIDPHASNLSSRDQLFRLP